eukprot:208551_1
MACCTRTKHHQIMETLSVMGLLHNLTFRGNTKGECLPKKKNQSLCIMSPFLVVLLWLFVGESSMFTNMDGNQGVYQCDPSEDCFLSVPSQYSWWGSTLECPPNHACSVICHGNSSRCVSNIKAQSTTILNITCNTIGPSRMYATGVCGEINIEAQQINNLNLHCNGERSCNEMTITASFTSDIDCHNDIASTSGFNIHCNGLGSCRWGLLSLSSDEQSYNNWNYPSCALSQANIICNGDSSCSNLGDPDFTDFVIPPRISIYGDLHMFCKGTSACSNSYMIYKPPIYAANKAYLICEGDIACYKHVFNGITANQIIIDCIGSVNEAPCTRLRVQAPIFPFNDIQLFDSNRYLIDQVNVESVLINCNALRCDLIHTLSILGNNQITPSNDSSLCLYQFLVGEIWLDHIPHWDCSIDNLLATIQDVQFVVDQEYVDTLSCDANKDCYVFAGLSIQNCNYSLSEETVECTSQIINCPANKSCSLFSTEKFGYVSSVINAIESTLLYITRYSMDSVGLDDAYGSAFKNATIYAPHLGDAVLLSTPDTPLQYEYATINAQNSSHFIFKASKQSLNNAILHLEHVTDARFACHSSTRGSSYSPRDNEDACSNSIIYITNEALDVANGNVIPYDRFCFDCYGDSDDYYSYPSRCENITFFIDDGADFTVSCITRWDNTTLQFLCHDDKNNNLYPLSNSNVTDIDWDGGDRCHVYTFIDGIDPVPTSEPTIIPTKECDDDSNCGLYEECNWFGECTQNIETCTSGGDCESGKCLNDKCFESYCQNDGECIAIFETDLSFCVEGKCVDAICFEGTDCSEPFNACFVSERNGTWMGYPNTCFTSCLQDIECLAAYGQPVPCVQFGDLGYCNIFDSNYTTGTDSPTLEPTKHPTSASTAATTSTTTTSSTIKEDDISPRVSVQKLTLFCLVFVFVLF